MVKSVLCVITGGAAGALCRWGLASWINGLRLTSIPFPSGIFVVNMLGCLLFGFFMGLGAHRSWFAGPHQLAILTGFLGSFTTFSTFGWNTLELTRDGHVGTALSNVVLSVAGGVLGVWAGFALACHWFRE